MHNNKILRTQKAAPLIFDVKYTLDIRIKALTRKIKIQQTNRKA